jgi:hypothetical protein
LSRKWALAPDASARRHQKFGEAPRVEVIDRVGRKPAQPLGVLRTLGQWDTNSGVMVGVVAETAGMPVTLPYFLVWNCGRSGREHDLEEAFAARGRAGAWLRAREVQEADAGGEGGVGAQVGVVRIEPRRTTGC